MLKQNPDQIDWESLSSNPAAIQILEDNPHLIEWSALSSNPAAIHLLEANPDQIDWFILNENPAAIDLLEANLDKIEHTIYENPNIFEYDYEGMKEKTGIFVEELMSKCFNPKNLDKFEAWGYE